MEHEMTVSLVKVSASTESWALSVFNNSTLEYVIAPEYDNDARTSRDAAKRELQSWLLSEANAADNEDDAALLDDAAQQLNYAEWTHIGGSFDWTVETVQTAY
jgi:hypothetical protein